MLSYFLLNSLLRCRIYNNIIPFGYVTMSCINIYYSRSFIYCRNESKHKSRYHYFLLISLMKNTLFQIHSNDFYHIRIYTNSYLHLNSVPPFIPLKQKKLASKIPILCARIAQKNFSYRQKGRTHINFETNLLV